MMYIPSVFSAVVEQLDHVRQEDAAHLHALWASGRGFQQSRNHLQDLCHNNNNNMSTHQHAQKKYKYFLQKGMAENVLNYSQAIV